MKVTFHFDEYVPDAIEIFDSVIRHLTDEQLQAAGQRMSKDAQTHNGFAPKLLPGDVISHAEAAIPNEKRGLNWRDWKWGKDEQGRLMAWHPDMRTKAGELYPQLKPEDIARAHPKLKLKKWAANASTVKTLISELQAQWKQHGKDAK